MALYLKGLQAWDHNVDLDAGQQHSEAFLKIKPLGAIPTLVDLEPGRR